MTPNESSSILVGSGHFAIGFVLGFMIMFVLIKARSENIKIQLYSPFLPIIFGLWAALPYFWLDSAQQLSAWLNLFILYPVFHHNEMVVAIFGKLNLVALICGVLYSYIIIRYIRLVKYCRTYGWKEGVENA